MPRTYIRKRQEEPAYSVQDLQNAVADVVKKKLNYRQAAAKYGIPVSNIYNRIRGRKITEGKLGSGRKCELSPDVEGGIAKCLEERSKMGYPCSKQELLQLVHDFVRENEIETRFKDGKPGHDWYIGFMRRHPQLIIKKAERLQKSSKAARDPAIEYDFYDKLESAVTAHNILPLFIYNADESWFGSDPSKIRAIGTKGNAGRENTTVLACVAADGSVLPPMVVFKGAAVQARWTSPDAFPGTVYAASRSGCMEEPHFFHWFQTSFVEHVCKQRVEMHMPNAIALLLYDGHVSHISLRVAQTAIQANIQIFKVPSHLTPLDKCVFGPVKKAWDQLVEFGKDSIGVGTGRLQKCDFVHMLSVVWTAEMKKDNIVSGFRSTGIWPLNRSSFPETDLEPPQLEICKRRKATEDGGEISENNLAGPSVSGEPMLPVIEVQSAEVAEIPAVQVIEVQSV